MSEEPQEYEARESLPYVPSASFQQDAYPLQATSPAEHTVSIPPEPPFSVVPDSPSVGKKGRRGLWITISLIALLIVSVSSFFVISYINRSTPTRTLDTFCNALRQQDYQSAYNQFSQKLQKTFSESTFANNFMPDAVTACTYTSTRSNGQSVITSMRIVHGQAGANNDVVTLIVNRDQEWKIDDFYRI